MLNNFSQIEQIKTFYDWLQDIFPPVIIDDPIWKKLKLYVYFHNINVKFFSGSDQLYIIEQTRVELIDITLEKVEYGMYPITERTYDMLWQSHHSKEVNYIVEQTLNIPKELLNEINTYLA